MRGRAVVQAPSGTLATRIMRSTATSSRGDSTIAIAEGVAVPVAHHEAYIAYTRSKGRLGRSRHRGAAESSPHYALEREVQRAHENDLFEMDSFFRLPTDQNHHKLNKASWLNA